LVEDRFEQQKESYNMLQIEKWVTFLILAFVLLIAVFNVVGSIIVIKYFGIIGVAVILGTSILMKNLIIVVLLMKIY